MEKKDCYDIFPLNDGKYIILIIYLTHIPQFNDCLTWFVVGRILLDPEEAILRFMAPAITGSFSNGS